MTTARMIIVRSKSYRFFRAQWAHKFRIQWSSHGMEEEGLRLVFLRLEVYATPSCVFWDAYSPDPFSIRQQKRAEHKARAIDI